MQEELEYKSIALSIRTSKLTARLLAKAMLAAIRKIKRIKSTPKAGEQSLKRLTKNGSLSSIEITDDNIKDFDPIARKYGIGYALQRDDSTKPPTWLVFFNCKDLDAMTAAFKEFSKKTLEKESDKNPSVREAIRKHNREKTEVNVAAASKDIDMNAVRVKLRGKGVPEL